MRCSPLRGGSLRAARLVLLWRLTLPRSCEAGRRPSPLPGAAPRRGSPPRYRRDRSKWGCRRSTPFPASCGRGSSREVRALSPAGMANRDPAGYGKLREAIAAYLAIARGVSCTSSQVFVTAGYQGGLSLIARTLVKRGDQVWFEDPG